MFPLRPWRVILGLGSSLGLVVVRDGFLAMRPEVVNQDILAHWADREHRRTLEFLELVWPEATHIYISVRVLAPQRLLKFLVQGYSLSRDVLNGVSDGFKVSYHTSYNKIRVNIPTRKDIYCC